MHPRVYRALLQHYLASRGVHPADIYRRKHQPVYNPALPPTAVGGYGVYGGHPLIPNAGGFGTTPIGPYAGLPHVPYQTPPILNRGLA